MPVLNNTYFEEHADELLSTAKLNKAQFASKMGVARQNIQKVFETKNIVTLQRASDVLGVPLDLLLYGRKQTPINGYLETNGVIYSIKTKKQFVELIDKVDGIVHIPSFDSQDKHKVAVKEFIATSINTGKSGALMGRYDVGVVFTLSYDAQFARFTLTLCVGDGEIQFKIYDINNFKIGDDFTHVEMNALLETIVTMIDDIIQQENE